MQSRKRTIARSSTIRRALVWAAQLMVFALSGVAAFSLRFDFGLPSDSLRRLSYALPIWIVLKVAVFRLAKLDRGVWEYVTIVDIVRLAIANLVASVLSCIAILIMAPGGFPRSIYVLDLLICFLGTAVIRVAVRILRNSLQSDRGDTPGRRTLIYGAGKAGITLLCEIQNNPRLAYRVCGFLDDNPGEHGLRIAEVSVLGGGEELKSIVDRHDIDVILIAVPSASGTEMTRILSFCHAADVECQTVPGLGDIIEGAGLANQIREVAVEDLLGRTPVRLEEECIRSTIEGRVILVTGAAGSIGSELCLQIARFHPAGIVGFDIAESPLFEIDREMRQKHPNVPFYPEIGSIQNRARIDEVLRRYRPAVIYHAAAYKHVPLMEEHAFEAIENNIFGTYNIAMSASAHGVEDFVLISSDKAVRPTNIMGATKRVAELILLALQNGGTQYIAVRFGNVLGSNGSVVPIFKKQIASGGPVTVTHREMRRFFMIIPEACQLVLQASAIGKGGQICVLDMGEPVLIADLAKNLILLSGLIPDKDIRIEFTGIRPGEKLYEELRSLEEDTVPSEHERIRVFVGNGVPEESIHAWIDSLREICETRDIGRLVIALKRLVGDYSPSTHLLELMIESREQRDFTVPLTLSHS